MPEREKPKSLSSEPRVEIDITLNLSEVEARALEAIAGYGTDAFLKVFYEKLGKHYLQPHQKGVHSLFETIQKELPKHLKRVSDARFALSLKNK